MCALSTASPQLTASSSSLACPTPRQIQQLHPMENHSIQEELTSSSPPKDSDDCCCCFKEQEDMFVAEVLLSISTRKPEVSLNAASLPLTTLTPAPSSPEPKDSSLMTMMMMMGNHPTTTTTTTTNTNSLEENCNSSVLPPFAFAKLTGAGWSYYIQSTSITLGRHQENLPDLYDFYKENHVFLAGSKLISRLHARILFNGETRCWEFHCIGRNGAFVDGKFCEPTQMACLGRKSLIEIGGIVFYFLLPNLASTNTQNSLENASQTTSFSGGNSCIEGCSNSINCLNNNEAFGSEEDHISLSLPSPFSTRTNNNGRPAKSYASLISEAILSVPERKMTLSAIYNYLIVNYPYFASAKNGWQNSIRHNLSLNKAFRKVPRKPDEPGKGMFWMVDASLILPSSNAAVSSFAAASHTAAPATTLNNFNSSVGGGGGEEREIVNYCRPMYHSVVAAQVNDSLLAMSSSPVPTSSSVGPTTNTNCSVNRIKFRVSPAEKMFS